jgi:hypothetical protein
LILLQIRNILKLLHLLELILIILLRILLHLLLIKIHKLLKLFKHFLKILRTHLHLIILILLLLQLRLRIRLTHSRTLFFSLILLLIKRILSWLRHLNIVCLPLYSRVRRSKLIYLRTLIIFLLFFIRYNPSRRRRLFKNCLLR